MNSPETLIKATINSLSKRLGDQFIESITQLSEIAKDAPERIRNEWDLFQEEVFAEADRLEKESMEEESPKANNSNSSYTSDPQEKVDQLRQKVAELNKKFEARN